VWIRLTEDEKMQRMVDLPVIGEVHDSLGLCTLLIDNFRLIFNFKNELSGILISSVADSGLERSWVSLLTITREDSIDGALLAVVILELWSFKYFAVPAGWTAVECIDAVVGSEVIGLVVEGEFGIGETVGDTANGGTEVGGVVAGRLLISRTGNGEGSREGMVLESGGRTDIRVQY
jgi:hypothetical protein